MRRFAFVFLASLFFVAPFTLGGCEDDTTVSPVKRDAAPDGDAEAGLDADAAPSSNADAGSDAAHDADADAP